MTTQCLRLTKVGLRGITKVVSRAQMAPAFGEENVEVSWVVLHYIAGLHLRDESPHHLPTLHA